MNRVVLFFLIVFELSCSDHSTKQTEFRLLLTNGLPIYFSEEGRDSLLYFQDSVASFILKTPADSILKLESQKCFELKDWGITLYKKKAHGSNSDDIFIISQKTRGSERFYALPIEDKNFLKTDSVRIEKLLLPFYKDSVLLITWYMKDHGWSPYFNMRQIKSGIQVWDLKKEIGLFSFYPISETYENVILYKGDYDEEVNGCPVIGTSIDTKQWRYSTTYSEEGIQFKLDTNIHVQEYDEDLIKDTDFRIDSSLVINGNIVKYKVLKVSR